MNRYTNSTYRNIAFLLIAALLFSSVSITYADPIVPSTVRIGLSYNSAANNNFILKSDGGMKISTQNSTGIVELFSYAPAKGLKLRKDAYYNIIDNKETEINYVKAAKYEGLLIGPYHIQVGEVYPDMASAKTVADSMLALTQSVYLAYENGWRVWTELYLDEGECLRQIQVYQNEIPSYTYSVVAPSKQRIHLLDPETNQLLYIINADQEISFEPIPVGDAVPSVGFKTLKYRGRLSVKRVAAGHINVINTLPFEQYLYGVVSSEMPSSWHKEALKAQAVAARNYAMMNMTKHTADGFDLCSTVHCQAYNGFGHEKASTNQSVDETMGKLLLYDGKIVTTYYYSSSGGRTENSENVWAQALPYLKGVDDKYGLGSPYDNWEKKYNKADISKVLLASKIDIGDILDIVPTEYSTNGRVMKLEIRGSKGNTTLLKEKFRSLMGSTSLRSNWYKVFSDADLYVQNINTSIPEINRAGSMYVVTANGTQKLSNSTNKVYIKSATTTTSSKLIPENYVFKGKGNGHGVGMSQYGAKGMAEAGFNFIQILEYYYTGAKVN